MMITIWQYDYHHLRFANCCSRTSSAKFANYVLDLFCKWSFWTICFAKFANCHSEPFPRKLLIWIIFSANFANCNSELLFRKFCNCASGYYFANCHSESFFFLQILPTVLANLAKCRVAKSAKWWVEVPGKTRFQKIFDWTTQKC